MREDKTKSTRYNTSVFSDYDIHLFKEGKHFKLYEKLGSHPMVIEGEQGTYFSVWAPNAKNVSVIGDFNNWNPEANPLGVRWDGSGIWEGFIPGAGVGSLYKYHIISKYHHYKVDKKDPFGFYHETPPKTASIIWSLDYKWKDAKWMKKRHLFNSLDAPFSIYEVHPGSWRRVPEENNRFLTYREMAKLLPEYISEMCFTHVEFMPVMEHPFYGSWGYQITGYFAPTSRYGSPQDFMELIDKLHQRNIGVILDFVPSHFPADEDGLSFFDGTCLYEHADPRKGLHPDWKSYIFNYGRNEVRSFLISSALFWLEKYHADGLRLDAVASMLYLDYSRKKGEWIPNEYGGNENIQAIEFLRELNSQVYKNFPDVQTIAEESTAWPMVSRPTYVGGLGFGMKWDMGWMHDTLEYMSKEPIHRKYHHDRLTFRLLYAFHENFVLPLSHDEVVHGKGSLLSKMPGDDWQKFANLRLLLGYMFVQPGKKVLFMGGEFGQWQEWDHQRSLDWHLLEYLLHRGVQNLVRDLNTLYRNEPCLHELDFSPEGFEWIDCNDTQNSVISFLRKSRILNTSISRKRREKNRDIDTIDINIKNINGWESYNKSTQEKESKEERKEDEVDINNITNVIVGVFNFTPVPRYNYRIGLPCGGYWEEILNSDANEYGGSGIGNLGGVIAFHEPYHGRPCSAPITLPPLAAVLFKWKPYFK
ncbi:MAG: 1,4-alpha-glucan branching protein GlgB [Actinobacteria bacterium]|nr:1,4-alpha-glucan branching protein GlgB [Actinomycetota bacterium]